MWLVLDQPCGHLGHTLQLHIQVNNIEIHLTLAKRGQLPLAPLTTPLLQCSSVVLAFSCTLH